MKIEVLEKCIWLSDEWGTIDILEDAEVIKILSYAISGADLNKDFGIGDRLYTMIRVFQNHFGIDEEEEGVEE